MSSQWAEMLMEDHAMIERVFDAVTGALEAPSGATPQLVGKARAFLVEYADGCHNQKEEQHLFPTIEARGIPRHGGPLAVMLQEHEQSRQLLKRLTPMMEAVAGGDSSGLDELRQVFAEYTTLMKNHYWKENDILYPMAQRVMNREDADSVIAGIEQVEASSGPDTGAKFAQLAQEIESSGGVDDLSKGVDPNVMAAILNTLPVELSFVDHEDRVRYFSHEHHAKIFPRTRGVIGNAVQNCHPQKSVHMVNRILEDFKAGKREVAEFWIDAAGQKIYIRYFPVRGPAGTYLGCLEVVQDVTRIQGLEGQRRLLDDE
jgi:DUF438 domain-containing protein